MLKLKVPDMTCGHCVRTIEKAVKAIDAEADVRTDLAGKLVTIESRQGDQAIVAALRSAGYESKTQAA